MKRDNGKLIYFIVAFVVVMVSGLYIDSIYKPKSKYDTQTSKYSVEVIPLPEEEKEPTVLSESDSVYASESGKKFHIKDDCGGMDPEKAIKMTVKEAFEKELSPCGRCLKGATIE